VLQTIPLEMLRVGEEGRVAQVDGDGPFVARLAEMGFREGALIRMLRAGSPCIVAVDDHRMTYRGDERAVILVAVGEMM
jgi:ferrous iron transport protein A